MQRDRLAPVLEQTRERSTVQRGTTSTWVQLCRCGGPLRAPLIFPNKGRAPCHRGTCEDGLMSAEPSSKQSVKSNLNLFLFNSGDTKPSVCFPGFCSFYRCLGYDVSCDVIHINTPSYSGQGVSDANINPAVFSWFIYLFIF